MAVFAYVGTQIGGSGDVMLGGSSTPQYVGDFTRAARYSVEPGGVYDRVDQPRWADYSRNYSTSYVIDTGSIGPLERRSVRMQIDKIEVNAPIRSYGMNAAYVPEVPLNGQEVAWYTFSAEPASGSNAVFAAHYTWVGGAVFSKLKELNPGDVVKLKDDTGTELTYTVRESFTVDSKDKEGLKVMGPATEDMITLITCAGTSRATGDITLGREYNQRQVVRAVLTKIYAPPGHAWNPG
jgi:LPXTG-site transpeptidase (sortase) family protein